LILSLQKKLGIPIANFSGVNNVTVAEHVFALLLSFTKNIPSEHNFMPEHQRFRLIGTELYGKTMGVVDLGNIGKEVVRRALAFG
jgi:D-3-phosphoglycerate dehydrogenase